MKQVEVTILGQSYLLACPDGGEQLLQTAVASVDREMSGIRDAGKVKARERIAVLAALNLAYRLAEMPRTAAAAPAAESATAQAHAEHVDHAEASEARRAAAAQLEAMIARLDTALSDDGRLL
ncbi:MAG: cell division protein ZapA [Betaproteobacteria bacterium]